MAHGQKPDFVFRRNGRVHLNRRGGVSSVDCWQPRCAAGYTMSRRSVKSTGYPLHSPVSPSLPPLPCVIVRHLISRGVYNSYFSVRNKYSVNYGKALNLLHSLRTKDTRNVKQAKAPKLGQLWYVFSPILAKSHFISFITAD